MPEDHEGPPTIRMAEAREAQLTDTPLFRLVKASIQTLKSGKVDKVKAGRKANPENVKRVEGILSAKDWEYIFAMRDPAYSYARFLQAVAKFPSLCGTYTDGRDSDQICRYWRPKRKRIYNRADSNTKHFQTCTGNNVCPLHPRDRRTQPSC